MERWSRVVPSVFERKGFWTVVLALTTIFAFLLNSYGMEQGFLSLTSHLFYIPIVIVAYWFPRNGVTATVAIAMAYLGTVYLSQYPDLESITQATTYFYVFVAIGVIVASLSSTQKEQERRYRAIFESSEAGVFLVVNLKSGPVIEEVNQKGASLLGYRPGELAGRPFLDLFPVEGEQKWIADGVSRGGSLSEHECHLRRKDGHVLHCLLSAGFLPGRRMVYTVVDITERKKAEEDLRASRRQYVDALNAMLDGIALIDRKGEIVLLNSTLAHWLSLSGREHEIVGRDAAVAIPCLREQAREAIRAVLETGESGRVMLTHTVRGKEHFFDTHLIPVRDGGEVTRVMVIMRDITRRRELEREKKRAYEQIEKNIEQFAVLGDHIRNPVQVILGIAELEGGSFAEKIRNQVREIERTVVQLDRGWVESEKIREFIRKYYGIGEEIGGTGETILK